MIPEIGARIEDASLWSAYDPAAAAERSRLELARLQALPRREQYALRKQWRMGLTGIAIALSMGQLPGASDPALIAAARAGRPVCANTPVGKRLKSLLRTRMPWHTAHISL